jgi:hypothetical protein
MGWACSLNRKTWNTCRNSVRKPLGKWLCGRQRRSREDKIKMDIKRTGCECKWLKSMSKAGFGTSGVQSSGSATRKLVLAFLLLHINQCNNFPIFILLRYRRLKLALVF